MRTALQKEKDTCYVRSCTVLGEERPAVKPRRSLISCVKSAKTRTNVFRLHVLLPPNNDDTGLKHSNRAHTLLICSQ